MSWVNYDFSDVVEFLEGPGVRNWQFQDNGIKLINIRNLVNDNIDLSNTINHLSFDEVELKYKHFLLEEGDYVIASSGVTWGKIAEVKKEHLPLCLNTSIIKIKPKNKLLYKKYLWFFIKSVSFTSQIERIITGSAQPNFGPSHLKQIQILLPPLATQKRIAEILDKADALRRKDQELLKKYDDLAQAIFIDMFGDPVKNEKGWEVKKLGLVTKMKAGNFISASKIHNQLDENLYPCFGGNGIRGYVESFTHDGIYILIGRQGALCGNVKITKDRFHATEHAIVCSPIIEYNVLWLYYLLGCLNLNKYSTGAAQPGLNVSTLVDIELIFAPINLQNQFADKLKLIEEQKEILKNTCLYSDNTFNSLLQKAFKGELD